MEDEANIMVFIKIVVKFALKCFLNHKNPISIDHFLPRLPKSICLVPIAFNFEEFNLISNNNQLIR